MSNSHEDASPRSRGGNRPSFASSVTLERRGRREGRVAAAPGGLAQKEFARARRPQVQAVTTDLPCAMVYGLWRALPDEPAFATVAGAKLFSLARAWRLHGRARTTRLRRP